MSGAARIALLSGGRRLHLQHGPIDIVAEAWGGPDEVRRAYVQAAARFRDILAELVGELAVLRRALTDTPPALSGPAARRMARAVWPHRRTFITPMAAVAGAVADEVLAAMTAIRMLDRAYVNNGGDIAFHVAPGERLAAGIVNRLDTPAIDADLAITHDMPSRGLATSGWRGRSLSFGIADAVTVLAGDAAGADAAATLIANAVNAAHPAIERAPASALRDDTDLGARPVTVAVGALPGGVVEEALDAGAIMAAGMRKAGRIEAAYLALQGRVRVIGGVHRDGSDSGASPAEQVVA